MINSDKRIIFIDLDSTLIKTLSGKDFALCISDMTPIWKTWNALKEWAKIVNSGYVFIVSNQGGIEKKTGPKENYLQAKFEFIKAALQEYLDRDCKKVLVDYTYCPYISKENYDRKPNPGMLEKMLQKYNLTSTNKNEMIMIGDASGRDINPLAFSDGDLKVAKNFNISYLDVNEL